MRSLLHFFFFLFFYSSVTFAVPENELETVYYKNILPQFTENAKSLFFKGKDDKQIHYYYLPVTSPQGVLVISPGQSEPALKYIELAYDLKNLNYDIYIIDHRGQGLSERLLEDPIKSHVENFSDYAADFTTFVKEIVKPQSYPRSVVLAHSMGGAVASLALSKNPHLFSKVILSAPMIMIETKPYPPPVALLFSQFLDGIRKSTQYAPGQKPFDPNYAFEDSTVTTSLIRFKINKELLLSHPELQIGGTTVRWVKTSLWTTRGFRGQKNVFQVPTLILQAGADTWVKPEGQHDICSASPQFCRIQVISNSKHEIFMEKDIYRDLALKFIRDFLN